MDLPITCLHVPVKSMIIKLEAPKTNPILYMALASLRHSSGDATSTRTMKLRAVRLPAISNRAAIIAAKDAMESNHFMDMLPFTFSVVQIGISGGL
ncbi:hypothetical protein CL614_01210 [archaeon]|nr:hypothetical protein [archaeon]